ncbi:GBF-interacting protein 1 isoform X1 [Ziziphus jujuba]|uniref:GBF-interacting protein 1 isoform X1 n=1 Tax=Ziziphus jujuba TaxID=326968 RepID=A0A6P4AUD3_ZIZJJ|nr:GBF-interacting protein 1 isoform X1 [Ziziphus jujuba]
MSTSGFSVSIPNSVRKTIQAIKEITGNHSEEKIYALLKECSMDPNETAQKLLLQETFHGVKRKHVRRKKNLSNKQPGEVRWRSGTQGRGGRGGRVALSPHFTSHDGGRGRSSGPGKENGLNQGAEKDLASLPTSYENKNKERSSVTRSAPVIANGPTNIASGSTSTVHASNILAGSGDPEISLSYAGKDISSSKLNPGYANKNPIAVGTEDSWEQPAPTPTSSLAVCFSSSDPVLEPSNDSQVPAALGLEREVGSHCLPATEIGSSSAQGMMPNSFQGVGKSQHTELSYSFSISTHGGFSVSLPSSNYSSWPQQIICGQNDVGSNKEWKSKPTSSAPQGPGTAGASEIPTAAADATTLSQPVSTVLDSEEAKLQKKLEELHLPQRQHVILPNHIHVPESERTKLSFGSFSVSSEVITGNASGEERDKCSTTVSETSRRIEDTSEEHSSRFVMYCILALGLVWIASLFA